MVRLPYVNPVTGPIHVEGATPEHVLACRIEGLELHPPGFTALVPGFGPFVDWIRHRDFGVHARVVDVRDGVVHWTAGARSPCGRWSARSAPRRCWTPSAPSTTGRTAATWTSRSWAPAARCCCPSRCRAALLFLGDCHAVQGDGELCGIGAIEIRTHTTIRVDLAPRPPGMAWPRFETETHIGAIACARPLEDAFRLSVEELVAWLGEDHGLAPRGCRAAAGSGRRGALHAARQPEVHLRHEDRQALAGLSEAHVSSVAFIEMSGTASATDTGQIFLAVSAACWKAASSIPGTRPRGGQLDLRDLKAVAGLEDLHLGLGADRLRRGAGAPSARPRAASRSSRRARRRSAPRGSSRRPPRSATGTSIAPRTRPTRRAIVPSPFGDRAVPLRGRRADRHVVSPLRVSRCGRRAMLAGRSSRGASAPARARGRASRPARAASAACSAASSVKRPVSRRPSVRRRSPPAANGHGAKLERPGDPLTGSSASATGSPAVGVSGVEHGAQSRHSASER